MLEAFVSSGEEGEATVSAADIPGWNSDITPWQRWIAPRIPQGGVYLEVGVFLGASLAMMGELRPDIQLVAVDPWADGESQGYAGPGIFANVVKEHGTLWLAFLRLMLAHAPDSLRRTTILRAKASMIRYERSVDLVFIDGAHDAESVGQDIITFAALVRRGGIVAGHDYDPSFPGVIEAVDAYYGDRVQHGIPGSTESPYVWWVQR